MQDKKNIVIIGGGFGGLVAAKGIAKQLVQNGAANLTLINKEDYQLYYPYLYEAATTEEELVTIEQLKRSLTLPIRELLPAGVIFEHGIVNAIDIVLKTVTVDGQNGAKKNIAYDYLIIAAGATVDFFGIAGLQEHALTLKSFPDCVRIRNKCEEIIEGARQDMNKRLLRFVVGGGGFSGVEFAGELANSLKIIGWKNQYPSLKIEIMIIEGMTQLLPGLDAEISKKIFWRLKEAGIEIRLNNFIKNVANNQVTVSTGEVINYDMLVWTGGVRSTKMPFVQNVAMDSKDRIIVNENFGIPVAENVFAIGDCTAYPGPGKRPLPQTATQSIYQGEYIADAIARAVAGQVLPHFKVKQFGYIISIRGKWAAMHLPSGFAWYGRIAWLSHVFAYARYLNRFMGMAKALRIAWYSTKIFARND